MRVSIASDHGGFDLARSLATWLTEQGHLVSDLGPGTVTSVDYPDYALRVADAIASGTADVGVLVCGSGIGMSIAANKVAGIRAAVVQDVEHARLAKAHNDANVLCLGGRFTSQEEGRAIVGAWLGATYEGGRHDLRLEKIRRLEAASPEAGHRD